VRRADAVADGRLSARVLSAVKVWKHK
jgi:hypothetical protein